MINPFDYLFYKICVAMSYMGGAIKSGAAIATLLLSNFWTVHVLLTGQSPSTTALYGISFAVLAFMFISLRPKRVFRILRKYRKESEKSRIIGNFIVACYVILSFVSVIWGCKV